MNQIKVLYRILQQLYLFISVSNLIKNKDVD